MWPFCNNVILLRYYVFVSTNSSNSPYDDSGELRRIAKAMSVILLLLLHIFHSSPSDEGASSAFDCFISRLKEILFECYIPRKGQHSHCYSCNNICILSDSVAYFVGCIENMISYDMVDLSFFFVLFSQQSILIAFYDESKYCKSTILAI